MAGAFPQLKNVTGSMMFQYNYFVTTMANAFPRLMWVGGYKDQ
jgi:hypothetical protein